MSDLGLLGGSERAPLLEQLDLFVQAAVLGGQLGQER